MSKKRGKTAPVNTGPNPAYVAKMQGIRRSGAAGYHSAGRVRSSERRNAIHDSRYN